MPPDRRRAFVAVTLLDLAAVLLLAVICLAAEEVRSGDDEDSPAAAAVDRCRQLDESKPVPAVECEVLPPVRRVALARVWM